MRGVRIVMVVSVARKVRRYAGSVYDLGLHVVWCPKYRRRVLREEFPHLRSRLPTLWSSSFLVASVGAVSADTVQRYIDTQ
jgi:REP element-mobilizing transposase RayT